MENASKALLMAGGILLTMLVISLLLYAWTSVSEYQANQDKLIEVQKVAEFNQQFTNYDRNDVQGYELLSLVNKVIDYNQRYSSEFDANKSAGNSAQYKPITVRITLDSSISDYTNRDKFTGSITVPAVAKITYQNKLYVEIINNNGYESKEEKYDKDLSQYDTKYRLFKKNEYVQNDTINQFQDGVLNIIYGYTNASGVHVEGLNDAFGGATNAQNLTKSIGTIFESKVIDYNGQPEETDKKNWYEQSYIENRYKILTGQNMSINQIRSKDNVKKILQYYEFMEFKKAEFKCTGINYDDGETGETNTGRVISINFEIKE